MGTIRASTFLFKLGLIRQLLIILESTFELYHLQSSTAYTGIHDDNVMRPGPPFTNMV